VEVSVHAVVFSEYGDPSVLRVTDDLDEPHADAGQVRIRVEAVAVNPFDWKVRSGFFKDMMPQSLPMVPGSDAAGVVDEVGEGVTGISIGDEVFGLGSAATADYTVLTEFTPKPAGMGWDVAAGLPVVSETALRTLELLQCKAGQTLLIEGAAGGVGSMAAQFAVADGLDVIGTASRENHDFLASIGVTPTTYGPGLQERVAALATTGVDRALDTVGHGSLPDLVAITGSPDNVVTIADYGAAQYGVRLTVGNEGRAFHALSRAAELFAAGTLVVRIAARYGFDQAAQAHELSQTGHPNGKVILVPSATA
jgi:NADPH:quinone reductase-like Zn-dependent oxidoreductase